MTNAYVPKEGDYVVHTELILELTEEQVNKIKQGIEEGRL